MTPTEIDDILRQTLDDLRLSRSEKRALGQVLADAGLNDAGAALVSSRAFELARRHVGGADGPDVLDWLEEVVKVVRAAAAPPPGGRLAEALFTPAADCAGRIVELFGRSRRTADVCVFTITHDRIADAILSAHRRGVAVRVITDDEKVFDLGSDVDRFVSAGMAVRTDRSEAHMHHKFAVFDRRVVLTGSYNWTRTAASGNQENIVLSDDPRLVGAFGEAFERLWREFA